MNALRRIALGVAVTGAAACTVPAIASADSTCTYTSSVREVDINDNSGVAALHIVRMPGGFIEVADGGGAPHFCFNPTTLATVDNTDTIAIFGPVPGSGDGYVLDQSGGALKSNAGKQIKTIGFSSTNLPDLTVIGTSGPDKIRIGSNGLVDLNGDGTSDFSNAGGAHEVDVDGGGGRDSISGTGFGSLGASSVQLALDGGDDNDTLSGGKVHDALTGGAGDDTLISSDLTADRLEGDGGFDTAIFDSRDLFADTIERQILDHSVPLGRLHLAPRVVHARAGGIARVRMSWTHPQAWRDLRTVMVRFSAAGKPVGMINVRPAGGVLTADGKVELAAGSRVSHHGKTVTARLALRLARSLGGKRLRISVTATDRHGAKQTEAAAGSVRVAR